MKPINRFIQIRNSAEPKVIGVKNGVYQVEIEDRDLQAHPNYTELDDLFISGIKSSINTFNEEVFKLEIPPIRGRLVKNAISTDLMGFCPYFFGCKYMVSQDVVDTFNELNIERSEYKLLPIELIHTDRKFYILFVPMISHEDIHFEQSLIYPSRQELKTTKDYFNIRSVEDYKKLIKETALTMFEKVGLPKKYQHRNIISIQGVANLYFSEKLFLNLSTQDITSFQVSRQQIEVSFH